MNVIGRWSLVLQNMIAFIDIYYIRIQLKLNFMRLLESVPFFDCVFRVVLYSGGVFFDNKHDGHNDRCCCCCCCCCCWICFLVIWWSLGVLQVPFALEVTGKGWSLRFQVTLPETNSMFAPENRPNIPQKERQTFSNHPFSGGEMFVRFRECVALPTKKLLHHWTLQLEDLEATI